MNRDTIEGSWKQMKGRIKERWGKLTDDERLEAEGKMDQSKADLKQAGENIKDSVENAFRDDK